MQALTFIKSNKWEIIMRDSNRPSLEDVAALAGVSTASISRCINSPQKVAEPTRQRIQNAIETLGYVPHFGGRALARNRTNTIGAIIPTMDNAMFASGLQAFQETLSAAGVTLLVGSSNYDPDQEFDAIRSLLSQGADGLLLIGAARPEKTQAFLTQHAVPHVLAWCCPKTGHSPSVGFDNQKSGHDITAHVLAHGHRKLAVICGLREGNDRATARVVGIKQAIASQSDAQLLGLEECKYSFEEAGAAFAQLLTGPEKPSAVICGSDVLAVGALLQARKMGLRVPEDISITGFDDISLAQVTTPGLTTVRVPQHSMGRKAAEVLLALLNQEPGQNLRHELMTTIIDRGTLARI
ncbi:LacI family DNA-binding transcriptional regulator [bacterium]|nr:LacI family DNA-binding transcriptional regulator [bacterium]